MKISLLFLIVILFSPLSALAQQANISVKQVGASYQEAPPGREKNLVPNGSFGAQEKVETHAVVIFKDRLIVDSPLWRTDAKVNATAILKDKSLFEMGTADVSSFRKVSEDRRKTLISMSANRLPDKVISGVRFTGFIKVQVAKSESHKTAKFEPKVGSRVDVGLGALTLSKIEANSITFSGGDQLNQVAAIKIIKTDGTILVGERGAYARRGDTDGAQVDVQYSFNGPVTAGKIEVTVYDALETIDVPINLIVAKPY